MYVSFYGPKLKCLSCVVFYWLESLLMPFFQPASWRRLRASPSTYVLSVLFLEGSFKFCRALFSICRMRSRVTCTMKALHGARISFSNWLGSILVSPATTGRNHTSLSQTHSNHEWNFKPLVRINAVMFRPELCGTYDVAISMFCSLKEIPHG